MPEEQVIETKLSRYNQALGQLIRMDYLWQRFHNQVLIGNLKQADFILDRIWGELSGDTNDEDGKKFEKHNKTLANFKTKGIYIKDKGEFYSVLMEKETFLRRIQNKQGKGTAYEEDDDFE